ncbi:hypothetical protein GIB67_002807 [Kingdonia uniflora]|uniref:Uncharacterized protein n=1 Tax=Kingdonia uniflora TaxID=39325 RepID=A0A7J7M577_9MAGN|nr:hypothetical protein GIB67_002807 [Kingdonia uniflora]
MVTTRRQAYEARVQTKMASLQTRYFGTQSLSLPTPIPFPPIFHGMSWEEVEEAEDDYHQMWQFHYVVLFAAHRRSYLRMLAEDAVAAEDEKAEMRSKNPKPSSKFFVSSSSEESSSSDRTMNDSEVIGTVTVDKPAVPSGRDVGLHAGIKTGQFFMTLMRPDGKIDHYQVSSLDKWKGNMGIEDDINISYYNGTGAEVCEALNKRWRDGGIARQFIIDDVLKYYKFKYVKDRKSGYLFSDLARPKFFDFESVGRPWCDHLVMFVADLAEPNPKGAADTSSLFDVVSQEGSELNKVLEALGIRREKRLNSIIKKVQRAHQNRAMATSGSAYDDIMEIPAYAAGTSSSLVRRPRVKRTVPPSEQIAPVQTPQVATEGVDADINMAPPLKKQKQESGKDIRAFLKRVNLKAVEQEALDLAKRDPIGLDTQIRSSISQLSVAWNSAAEKDRIEKDTATTKKEVEDEAKKVVDIVVASRNKLIQAFYFWDLSREDVDLALAGKYSEIIFPGDDASPGNDASPVAEQSLAPLMADDMAKEVAGANS